jgi:lysozyme family protein
MINPKNDAEIVALILTHEGGFVNNPADPGGATNRGITARTLAAWRGEPVTTADVQKMPLEEAIAIYEAKYLKEPNISAVQDLRARGAMADTAVLFGPSQAIMAVQQILRLKIDGVLGPITAGAINAFDARQLVNQIAVWRIKRHAARVAAVPSQLIFLEGWIGRAVDFIA